MSSDLIPLSPQSVGEVADAIAAEHALSDYQQKLSENTRRRHAADLALFVRYLSQVQIRTSVEELMEDITTWAFATHGIISGFARYQLKLGYAIGSINVRLATVKRYCSIAVDAHVLPAETFVLIGKIKGYSGFAHKVAFAHKVGSLPTKSTESGFKWKRTGFSSPPCVIL